MLKKWNYKNKVQKCATNKNHAMSKHNINASYPLLENWNIVSSEFEDFL